MTLVDGDAALARTFPDTHAAGEVREVEALYLDMIAAAKGRDFPTA